MKTKSTLMEYLLVGLLSFCTIGLPLLLATGLVSGIVFLLYSAGIWLLNH